MLCQLNLNTYYLSGVVMFNSLKRKWRCFNYRKLYGTIGILDVFEEIVKSAEVVNYIEQYNPNIGYTTGMSMNARTIDDLQLAIKSITDKLTSEGAIRYKFRSEFVAISLEDFLRRENGYRVGIQSGLDVLAMRAKTLSFVVNKVVEETGIPESTLQRKLTPVIRDITELARCILGD